MQQKRHLVYSVGLEVRRGGSGEGLVVVGMMLGRGIELGCCAAVRTPRLWLSPFRGDS